MDKPGTHRLYKSERLCSRKAIEDLFQGGHKSMSAYPIRAVFMPSRTADTRVLVSVPKSNGYESLHITVLGPEQKWVEVQIRTERMDEIAERGVAAHWRYKGVKGETGLDEWLNNIRGILENSDDLQVMDQFKMDLYEDEVFVFTPKGDLFKFPKGATVLDFAYHIHSKIGNTCTGARINNKVVTFREQLHSGDQIEILTSSIQKPKQDWLNVVKSNSVRLLAPLTIPIPKTREWRNQPQPEKDVPTFCR